MDDEFDDDFPVDEIAFRELDAQHSRPLIQQQQNCSSTSIAREGREGAAAARRAAMASALRNAHGAQVGVAQLANALPGGGCGGIANETSASCQAILQGGMEAGAARTTDASKSREVSTGVARAGGPFTLRSMSNGGSTDGSGFSRARGDRAASGRGGRLTAIGENARGLASRPEPSTNPSMRETTGASGRSHSSRLNAPASAHTLTSRPGPSIPRGNTPVDHFRMDDSYGDIDFELEDFSAESLMDIDHSANGSANANATAGPFRSVVPPAPARTTSSSGAAARSAAISAMLAAQGGSAGESSIGTAYSGSGRRSFPTKQSTLVNTTTLSALTAPNAGAGSSRPFNRTDSASKKPLPLNAYTYQPTAVAAYQTHLPFRGNQQREGKTWEQTHYAKSGRKIKPALSKGKGKGSKKKKHGFDPFIGESEGEDDEEEMERIDGEDEEEVNFDQFPKPFIDPSECMAHLRYATQSNPLSISIHFRLSRQVSACARKGIFHTEYTDDLLARPPAPPKHLPLSATTGTYIYPINIPKRDYQYEIIRSCFMDNTLVALPTGLGKTFIAGVVLLNFYRWFPTGKLIFLMPTKPLVTQQHEACQKTCGIPSADAATITGDDPRAWREDTWKHKRVIYATPQTFLIDMKRGRLDPLDVVLVIIDEAHKASGNHSYVQCTSYLTAHQQNFRVIGLSATPGRSTEKVQDIIDNLHISKVEIREAEAPEISKYMFDKQIFQHVVKMSPVIMDFSRRWGNMMMLYVKPLVAAKHLTERALDVYTLKAFAVRCLLQQGSVEKKFYGCISMLGKMALGMGYLLEFSLGMFHQVLLDISGEGKGGKNARGGLRDKPEFKRMFDEIEALRNSEHSIADEHPKLERCKDLLINHLSQDAEDVQNGVQETATKCMVFCSYRGAVSEIVNMLNEQQPLIRAHKFVGRSNTARNGGDKGLTQVEQKAVIEKFKKGDYNVLVATSIGEEGLDIGEVDFIIIYNCPRESIKMLQRIGRAGRKRDGKIHVFMTEGREDRNWNSANENHREIQAEIICGTNIELYSDVKRLLPGDKSQWPKCIEQVQTVDDWVSEDKKSSKRKRSSTSKAPAKKRVRGEAVPQEAVTGFVFASALKSKGKRSPGTSKRSAQSASTSIGTADDSAEEYDSLSTLSAPQRNSKRSIPSDAAEGPGANVRPPKVTKKPSNAERSIPNAVRNVGTPQGEKLRRRLFKDDVADNGGQYVAPKLLDGVTTTAYEAELVKEAGYSQMDAAWMLDDSDNEFDPHHIDGSVLARPFKPPSFARGSASGELNRTSPATSRLGLSRDMPPPSVPPRVLSVLQLNESPLTDTSPIPIRRPRKGKAVLSDSSPDSRRGPTREAVTMTAQTSPAERTRKRQMGTKARPRHDFIDFEAGVSDDDDEGDGLDNDSSGEEDESDRRFAGHFLPTQAPNGYNQRAAYAAGLATQAGPGGPAFEDRSHLRDAFYAKARRPVYLSQEEPTREGPSSEYDGSFVCGDDTVEWDSDA